jgi:hypothetical protein
MPSYLHQWHCKPNISKAAALQLVVAAQRPVPTAAAAGTADWPPAILAVLHVWQHLQQLRKSCMHMCSWICLLTKSCRQRRLQQLQHSKLLPVVDIAGAAAGASSQILWAAKLL